MIKQLLFVLTLLLLGLSGLVFAKHFWKGEVLDVKKVESRWGSQKFESNAFKNGDLLLRSKMAASLLKNQKDFIGKDPTEIRAALGDPDGFYFSDLFPAYLIQEAKTKKDEAWQIVFLLDTSEKVNDIIVHKNCCN